MSFNEQTNKELQESWIINFKEAYKKEMDGVCCPQALLKSQPFIKHQKYCKGRILKTAGVITAALCMIIGITNSNQIISVAESIFQSFTLSAQKQTMQLDSVEPIEFDIESYCADPKTQRSASEDTDGITYKHYFHNFKTYQEMHDLTKFTLPNADLIDYKDLALNLDFEHGYGHLCVTISYQGTVFGANGMFVTDAFQQETWGYGEHDKIDEAYEYADGRYAYFFEREDAVGTDTVYFVEDHIMFQLFVPKAETGREQAKTLLEVMSR